MFRLPFVSRERYDETVKRLESRIAAEIDERHKILDHLQLVSLGRPIFASPEVSASGDTRTAIATAKPPTEEDTFTADVKDAKAHGCRSANQIADFISRKNIRRDNEKRHAVTSRPATVSPASVAADFEAAIAEGQQAAGVTE